MSFFVFYIFATALISAQCEGVLLEESYVPHLYTEVANCRNHSLELRNNAMQAAIRPRETLVTLIPELNYEFSPRIISVNRCDGFCPDRWSPHAITITNKQFIVRLHRKEDPSSIKCVAVEVEEHLSCRCMCMHSEKYCTPSQDWIPASCSCLCKDRETKRFQCEAQVGMQWYDNDCSCACSHEITECPSGQKWAQDECRCVPQ